MSLFETVYRFFGWWIINIDSFFVLLILIGAALLLITHKKWGRNFAITGCFGLVFLAIVPIGLWTMESLENRFPKLESVPQDMKGMILLGVSFDKMVSAARKEISYTPAAGSFIKFIELAKEYPNLQLVFSGNPFEAETAKKQFRLLGIDPARVVFEGDSKDTKENAAKTADLIHPKANEKWLLVTSAYHMPRAVGLFEKAGFHVTPYPVDYHTPGNYELWFFIGLKMNLAAWHATSREWLGMVINYILGRSDTLYPGPKES